MIDNTKINYMTNRPSDLDFLTCGKYSFNRSKGVSYHEIQTKYKYDATQHGTSKI